MTLHEILWDDDDDDNSNDFPAKILSIGGVRRAQASISASQQFSKQGRKISGSKRVAKYRETQGYTSSNSASSVISGSGINPSNCNVEVLQSITANPALQHSSFEELRAECYAQSRIAKGTKPHPVDSVLTPWAVIPPIFNAYKTVEVEEGAGNLLGEVPMADQ